MPEAIYMLICVIFILEEDSFTSLKLSLVGDT